MKHSIRQMAFRCSLLVLPCVTLCAWNASEAQVPITVTQGDCSGDGNPCIAIPDQQGANAPQLNIERTTPFGPGQVAIVSTGGAVFGLQDEAAVVKSEPYQAQAVTEMKQTLADGSHIVQTNTATVARDSDGRTVRIQKLGAMGPWRSADSQGNDQTLTTIFDPVANEHIDFTSGSKVAHVITMPPLPSPGTAPAREAGPRMSMQVSGFAPAPPDAAAQGFAMQTRRVVTPELSKGMEPKTESLGTKTIDGVQVTGTRNTMTIPAGAIGNDKALVITHETWYSPELNIVVQSRQNDPRFGQSSYTLKNIQQGQPDETLFRVPAGYKIDKIVPRIVKAPAQ